MAQNKLTVDEASAAYESAMRNVLPGVAGSVCRVCGTWIGPPHDTCYPCGHQPDQLDVVVPITYSEHLGQMHTALRNYKDGYSQAARAYAATRLVAILWRFTDGHESCVARAAGVDAFDLVTTVPSSTPEGDERRSTLRAIVQACRPVSGRFERVLHATGRVPSGRHYDADRYASTADLSGRKVLLIDDTWTAGGHAQSAGAALRAGGASYVALIAVGRHVRPEWEVTPGVTSGDLLARLPKKFDWTTCRVHNV